MILVGKGKSFIADLHYQLKIVEKYIYQRPNFQGILALLIYNQTVKHEQCFINFITCEHGIINSLGAYHKRFRPYKRRFKGRNHYTVYDIQYNDNNSLFYNSDFQQYSILHHVNRFPEIYTKTYGYIKSKCGI